MACEASTGKTVRRIRAEPGIEAFLAGVIFDLLTAEVGALFRRRRLPMSLLRKRSPLPVPLATHVSNGTKRTAGLVWRYP